MKDSPCVRRVRPDYVSKTYEPGAGAMAGNWPLPRVIGADFPFARPLAEPFDPMHPPRAALLSALRRPYIRILLARGRRHEEGFGIAGRVQKALQVPAVRQHECGLRAKKPCALVARLPRRDMVRGSADDIGFQRPDIFQIDLHALDGKASCVHEWIGLDQSRDSPNATAPEVASCRRSSKGYRMPAADCRADSC